MNHDTKIDNLNELLPKLSQSEKIGAIYQISWGLAEDISTEKEDEFVEACFELDSDKNRVDVIQALANSLVK